MGLPCSRSTQIKHGGRRILPANFVIPDSHPLTSALLLTTIYPPQEGVNATLTNTQKIHKKEHSNWQEVGPCLSPLYW